MASTWPKVLSLSPAGPAVQMNELQEWMKRTQPVLMRVQPAPGTDDHGFGQLVKLLRERSFVSLLRFHSAILSRFEAVCSYGMGDSRHGSDHDEPSHRAILARPARCSVSDLWDARDAETPGATASRPHYGAPGPRGSPGVLQLAATTTSQLSRAPAYPHNHTTISSPATTLPNRGSVIATAAAATTSTGAATATATATAGATDAAATRPLPSKPRGQHGLQRFYVRESGAQAGRTQPVRTRESSERNREWTDDPADDVARTVATATAAAATAAGATTAGTAAAAAAASATESAPCYFGDATCAEWRPWRRRRRRPWRWAHEHGRRWWRAWHAWWTGLTWARVW